MPKQVWEGDTPFFDFVPEPNCRIVTSDNIHCFYDEASDSGTVLTGTHGCGFERGLEAMRQALGPELRNTYNACFLRDDATLVVIVVTDEEDCGNVGDVYELTRDGGNVEWGERDRWEITDACTTPGCTGSFCFAEPGTRYFRLARMFENFGFSDTICQEDFSEIMEKLRSFIGCPHFFNIRNEVLDPGLISIIVDGKEVPRYTCSVEDRVEPCGGPEDTSCSRGSCVETWTYHPPADPPDPKAAGGRITLAEHYNPCLLATGDKICIGARYVPGVE